MQLHNTSANISLQICQCQTKSTDVQLHNTSVRFKSTICNSLISLSDQVYKMFLHYTSVKLKSTNVQLHDSTVRPSLQIHGAQ